MLQGTLSDFTLADVFSLLALTKKTGALRITSQAVEGEVLFRDGLICLALADAGRVPLAARLVSAGHVNEAQVRAIVEQHSGSAVAVTEALLSSGQVEDRVLALFLREQIVDAVFELSRMKEGSFNFDASVPALSRGVGLSVVDVVSEAARRLEEWHSIGEHIPSKSAVLAMVPAAAAGSEGVTLLAEQWELLSLVDGRRTVGEVVELTGRGEFATCRVLGDLVGAGLLQACEGSGQSDLDKLLAAREALRSLERVEKSGIAPALSSAAPLAPGTSRIRWVEPPDDAPAPQDSRPGMMPSRSRMADLPRKDTAEAAPAATPPVVEPRAEEKLGAAPPPAVPVATQATAAAAAPSAKPERADTDAASVQVQTVRSGVPSAPTSIAPKNAPATAAQLAPHAERQAQQSTPGGSSQPTEHKREQPAVASPSGVDRAQVARELASLGLDDGDVHGDTGLTRDGDVNKGLLLRLIDGVKGA